jgi:cyclopropane fatty-acyl-phospholipid synthase-like methyltransferase
MLKILSSVRRNRSDLVYDLLSVEDLWSIDSNYLNLGYWPGVDNIDDASRQLADLVASRSNISGGQYILDVGCGLGDQSVLWAQNFPGANFCAIGNSQGQLKHALSLVQREGMTERVTVICCDANACPFPPQFFDRIIALESAFHFDTRQQFFEHAWQLLKPGGRIVSADFIAGASVTFTQRLAREVGGAAWQIPRANLCTLEQYGDGLRRAGFVDVEVTNITQRVIVPFSRFIRSRYKQPEYRRSSQPLVRYAARIMTGVGFLESLDYVIASANKPKSLS